MRRWKSDGEIPPPAATPPPGGALQSSQPAKPAPPHTPSPPASGNRSVAVAPTAVAPVVSAKEPAGETAAAEQSSSRWLRDDRVPAWLVSLILHAAIVLLLAILTTGGGDNGDGDMLTMGWTSDVAALPLMRLESTAAEFEQADDSTAAAEPIQVAVVPEQAAVQVNSPTATPTPVTLDSPLRALSGGSDASSLMVNLAGGRLGDRSGAGRSAAVASGATTAASEAAVDDALRWLAAHQHNDGGWSFRLTDPHGPCKGECKNPLKNPDDAPTPRTAATGLALLAFLGAGHTHKSGEYAEVVRHGIYFLRSQAGETSFGIDLQNGSMYGHGIASFALAEAYVLSEDEDLRDLLEGATMYCASAQNQQGGWGYIPGGPGDITLTGWQIMALKTAEQRGITSPTEVIPRAKEFVLSLSNESRNRFGYKTPEPRLSTTAIGLVLQLYFGHQPDETPMTEGLDWLASKGPSPTWPVEKGPPLTNVYYDYYAMLALHHSQHVGRMDFARALRDHLLATQASEGHEAGSWHFEDRYGSVGGRLYTTAMCALILQTPYRYVPLTGTDKPFKL